MINDFRVDWRERILSNFPERQIYVRSGGEVKCLTLSTRKQIAAASVLCFLVLWCLATLLNLLWGHNPLRSQSESFRMREARLERALEDIRAREAAIRDQLEEERASFEVATREFEEKHNTLAQLMSRTGRVDPVQPITSLELASSEVQMSPTVRDMSPRKARREAMMTSATGSRTLNGDFRKLDSTQNTFLVSAESQTLERIERTRAILTAADLDVEELVRFGPRGKGGPLVEPIDMPTLDASKADGAFGSRMTSIKARMAEADELDTALQSVPLGHPVADEHYRTSNYGMRRDPFTKRPTFHEGVDFAGRHLSRIVATADGVVSFVGNNGGYGRVVEIDHGHGFVTRYAHLAKTFVKRGDTVKKGDHIAGMGSTGRSTATHLHYEVHLQGRVFDPNTFMKAGRYVQ